MTGPSKRALILIDPVTPLARGPAPPPGIDDAIRYMQGELKYFRERDRLVFFSVADALLTESPLSIVTELTPRAQETVLRRPGGSVFSSPGLLEKLRQSGVKRITLVGIGTSSTVVLSAADALLKDFGVTVPDPCVCDHNVDDHHAALRLIREVWTPLLRGPDRDEVTAPGVAPPQRS